MTQKTTKLNIEVLNKEIKASFSKWKSSGNVSLIYQNQVIIDITKGYANIEKKSLVKTNSRYLLSLASPLFVQLGILILIDQGLISMDDDLSKYIGNFAYAKRMTIKHLLTHSTGLPDYHYQVNTVNIQKDKKHQAKQEEEKFIAESKMLYEHYELPQIIAQIENKSLEFEPGSRSNDFSYSNLFFLKAVIEKVSNENMFSFFSKHMFRPLKMNDTIQSNQTDLTSYGCMHNDTLVPFNEILSHQDIISMTKDDMIKLMQAFVSKKLLSSQMWKTALRLDENGESILAENANGIYCVEAAFLGFELNLYFDQKAKLGFFHLTNQFQISKQIQDDWYYFRRDLRKVIETLTTYPNQTKLERYSQSNGWYGMQLSVADDQKHFVFDAKGSLAYTLMKPKVRKAYVLMEGMRAIGLMVLSINPKEQFYNVDVLLVDHKFQNRGYGKIMLKQGLEILRKKGAKKIEIGVNRRNVAAIKLYRSLGFREVAVWDQGMGLAIQFD
jgi:CubicO group peptidase (beta-lactamase class C family)/ribosomal protein S18 acetylase RimI-like enzyme